LRGDVVVDGRPYRPRHERDAIDAGLGFLPPDRKGQGLVLNMSVGENLVLASTSGRSRWSRPDPAEQQRAFAEATDTLRLRCHSMRLPVGSLSGGNQQKVAIAKWLAARARLLLLDEPTRGVDVAAKGEIHDRLRAVARQGLAMVVSSSENGELLDLCDRILVMFAGRVVGDLTRGEATEAGLAALAGGHR
jgi:ABC-type sugar transport system ATPase subunit